MTNLDHDLNRQPARTGGMAFDTAAIHCGEEPDYRTCGNVVAPIHLSTTFARKQVDKPTGGYDYSRTINPTRKALETKLAALEGARYALAFGSGFAAVSMALMATLHAGDHLIALDDVYCGTKRVIDGVMQRRFGVEVTYVDHRNFLQAVEDAMRPNTRLVWIEGLSNPLLSMVDIAQLAQLVHRHGVLLGVDNTFMSPYCMRPLQLGADIVVHSTTKYMSGHSDVISGAVMVNDDQLRADLAFCQNAIGAVLSPWDSYMLMRGLKTLAVRMQRHQQNAMTIARWLEQHPRVSRVIYLGLESHPQHQLAQRQCTGYGGMITFVINPADGDPRAACRFVENLQHIALAESLGGVESLIEVPSLMTNIGSSPDDCETLGINDLMVRLSVGIEDVDDLIADLQRGFDAIGA